MPDTNGWHVDKRVSIGHIATTLIVAVSVVFYASRIENRVELNSQSIKAQRERIDWIEQAVRRDQGEIKDALREIRTELRGLRQELSDKVDR